MGNVSLTSYHWRLAPPQVKMPAIQCRYSTAHVRGPTRFEAVVTLAAYEGTKVDRCAGERCGSQRLHRDHYGWAYATLTFKIDDPAFTNDRWIKKKIEQPCRANRTSLTAIGTDAGKRVLNRHGNKSAQLFIVVSPGNVDAATAAHYLTLNPTRLSLSCRMTEGPALADWSCAYAGTRRRSRSASRRSDFNLAGDVS